MAGLLADVLPSLFSGADQIKRRVKGLLGDPKEFLGQRLQDLQTMQDQDSALAYRRGLLSPQDPAHAKMARNEPAFNAQQAAAAEQRLLDIAMQGLTVWHGSPHKFDKFDSAHIGKGEGAQAYGHGLYLAESPGVAKSYEDTLARADFSEANLTEKGRGFLESAVKRQADEYTKKYGKEPPMQDLRDKVLNEMSEIFFKPTGNLYKVDLPDSAIERMLDWDKPLSQQPEFVKKALAGSDVKYGLLRKHNRIADTDYNAPTSGGVVYNDLANAMVPEGQSNIWRGSTPMGDQAKRVSEHLRSLGIPGIRYLDGGSRGAGQGTRNFVVFPGEEGLLTILERNGGLLGAR